MYYLFCGQGGDYRGRGQIRHLIVTYFGFYVLLILWSRWRLSRVRTDTPSNIYFGFYVLFILWWRWRPSRVRTDTPSSTMSPSAFSSRVSECGKLFSSWKVSIYCIERSPLSLVLQTPSKSFRHYSMPRVVWGMIWEVKSMPRICKSSYGGKLFWNIFISIYVNLNGFRANRYE